MATELTDAGYAFWASVGNPFTIVYSLGIFHEIDFVASEGYRRIPHGGIETGGLLFGQISANRVTIEAFRPIECEHASGPSFVLSTKDLAKLREQISSSSSDPDLENLEPVGWFIAHTRGPLILNENELSLFNDLFPGAGKVTVLVKPERFQATRFGFLMREEKGEIQRDASESAIILPLPGRASHSVSSPVPSIPAPIRLPPKPPETPSPIQAAGESKKPESPPAEIPVEKQEVPVVFTTPKTEALPPIPRESVIPREPIIPLKPEAPIASEQTAPAPSSVASQTGFGQDVSAYDFARNRRTRRLDEPRPSGVQFAFVLVVAALLGCCVGYWAYLQLPSAIVPLKVRIEAGALIVSWPPNQTQSSAYAAIRVDDGDPVPLSAAEKTAGQTAVPTKSDDIKIELIAQHWMRDSRGIVRFIRGRGAPSGTGAGTGQAARALP
jgi:hypothetical protein